MKKILMPLFGLASVAAVAVPLTSCQKPTVDPTVIPTSYIATDDDVRSWQGILSRYEDTDLEAQGYSKLVVPSYVLDIADFDFNSHIAYNAIHTIIFNNPEEGLEIDEFCFNNLPKLTTVVFPADCSDIEFDPSNAVFTGCDKLNVLDFSATDMTTINARFTNQAWILNPANEGILYVKDNDSIAKGEAILSINSLKKNEYDWKVEVKQ